MWSVLSYGILIGLVFMVLYVAVRWREKGRSRRAMAGLVVLAAAFAAGVVAAEAGVSWAVWAAAVLGVVLVVIAFTDAVPEAERSG